MDPVSIVEDRAVADTNLSTDRQTDRQGETSIPPFQLRLNASVYSYTSCTLGNPFAHLGGKTHNTPLLIVMWKMLILTDLTNIHVLESIPSLI